MNIDFDLLIWGLVIGFFLGSFFVGLVCALMAGWFRGEDKPVKRLDTRQQERGEAAQMAWIDRVDVDRDELVALCEAAISGPVNLAVFTRARQMLLKLGAA